MLPRNLLPQIPKEELSNFAKFMRNKHDISSHIVEISCNHLIPIQKHLNKDKIKSIIDEPSPNQPPIIISGDNHLLDGHHRWAAEAIQDKDKKIKCLQFNCSISKLLELGHLFDGSEVKTIHEMVLAL